MRSASDSANQELEPPCGKAAAVAEHGAVRAVIMVTQALEYPHDEARTRD